MSEGIKYDAGKPRMDLVPWDSVRAMAEVMTFGAAKYEDRNYYGLAQSRLYAAVQRHLTAWFLGEDADPETSLSHLAHAMAGVAMLLEKDINKQGEDDRPWRTPQPSTVYIVGDARDVRSHGSIGAKWRGDIYE